MTRRFLVAAVSVLLLAAFLRFHLLDAQSFWNDEGNSARLSERAIPAILEGTASDVHPPLYYLFLRAWRELVGESEFGLRSLSAFAGVLTVAAVVALARHPASVVRPKADQRRRKTNAGLPDSKASAARGPAQVVLIVAGLLAAANPVLVYYAQEARMYALLALLAALSAWVLGLWLRAPRWPHAIAYVLLLAMGLYTHYFFPAVVAAQGLVVLLWVAARGTDQPFRMALAWAGMALISAVLYAPWLPIFVRQIGGRAAPDTVPLVFLGEAWRWMAVGSTMPAEAARWFSLAAAALFVIGVLVGRGRAIAPLVLALSPVAFSLAAGATDPAFFKFLLTGVPFLCVLGGLAFDGIARRRDGESNGPVYRAIIALGLLLVYLTGAAISLTNLYSDPVYARADYRGMAARIAAEAHPNAGIILVAPNQWEAFTYYHREGAPVYPLPRGQADPAILEPELEEIAAAHDRVYALYWGEGQRDPERVVEHWLDAHTFKASEEWVGDVRFVVYAVPAAEDEIPMQPIDALFLGLDGESIRLSSAGFLPAESSSGDIIQVRLNWSADGPTARPYKVFVHLIDAAGALVAQRDGEPAGGSRPTTSWTAGESIIDNQGLLIPPGTPPGAYELRLGLYDAADPASRLIAEPMGHDAIVLGTVIVR